MVRPAFACFLLALVAVSIVAATQTNVIEVVSDRGFQRGLHGLTPDTPQALALLFGDDAKAAGIPLRRLTEIYEDAYQRGSDHRPLWKRIDTNTGWWAALALLFVAIFRDAIKSVVTRAVSQGIDIVYSKLAGLPLLRTFALRRYRAALRLKYNKFPVTFRPGIELEMRRRYVPLRVGGPGATEGEDAYSLLRSSRYSLILGAPGSGKSLLLRSMALAYGENRRADFFLALPRPSVSNKHDKVIPVLVELSTLNDGPIDIEAKIVESLGHRDFPRASRFVQSALADGKLLLLLDGFDEVSSTRRDEVAHRIHTLVDRYYSCRYILTCRGPAYHGEFDSIVSDKLEVVEFTDQQIITFLRPWQERFPAGKNVEQLMQTLRDRPQIMRLARNPLLLTIVAFLYTDKEFILPNSRAEFYDQAADILLRQWKGSQNIYKGPQKRLVLQHLALHNHVENDDSIDRRTMAFEVVARELRSILPKLSLEEDDADPLLNEIIERSSLLMRIDNGTRYQFPHLTLQEFFAAAALADDPDGLCREFSADPDSWREVVKLWCGLEHDSTKFIKTIESIDPLTAFECLADAQKIEPEAAEAIIAHFCRELEIGRALEMRVQHAFAAVASDRRARGKGVFEFLCSMVSSPNPDVRHAAASALSLTNLPDSAEYLAGFGSTFQPLLVRMGDVAVAPAVQAFLGTNRTGELVAILSQIATPAAYKAMLALIYREDAVFEAAVAIGSTFDEPATLDAVADFELSADQLSLPSHKWVWKPFIEEEHAANVAHVAGRVVALLEDRLIDEPQRMPQLDPRLLIALCFIYRSASNHTVELNELSDTATLSLNSDETPRDVRGFLAALLSLPPIDIGRVARVMVSARSTTTEDWENLRSRVNYEFASGWHLRVITALLLFCSIFAAGTAVAHVMRAQYLAEAIRPAIVLLSLVVGWHWRWTKIPGYDRRGEYRQYMDAHQCLEEWLTILTACYMLPFNGIRAIIQKVPRFAEFGGSFESNWSDVWIQILVVLFTPGLLFYYHMGLQERVSRWGGLVIIIATIAVILALAHVGVRRERAARNPLRGVLEVSFFATGKIV